MGNKSFSNSYFYKKDQQLNHSIQTKLVAHENS